MRHLGLIRRRFGTASNHATRRNAANGHLPIRRALRTSLYRSTPRGR